jgi:hypothetical protein
MQKFRILIASFLVLLGSMFSAPALWAEPISLTDLGVDNAQGSVSVGFSIAVNDLAPLMEALQNGGNYEVICSGKLYQRRMGFWDSFLAEARYSCTLEGKPIARECLVEDQRGVQTLHFTGLPDDLNRFWSRLSLPMGSWDSIERGQAYRVVLTFSVKRTNIPGWVSKPLFFVSWDLVPEVVYTLDFDF